MAKWTLYHNPKCSKSREALTLLQSKNLDLEVIEYLKTSPDEKELKALISKLKEPISNLVRTKEPEFQESPFDLNSAEQVIRHLVRTPKLLERPVVVKDAVAVVARPLEKIENLF
jgi:arsenate reductase